MRITAIALVIAFIAITSSLARTTGGDYQRVERLYFGNTTVVGETVHYPQRELAKVSALIITMAPGEDTGWHTHEVPLLAYILEGELQVDYGEKGVRTYRKGDAFLEAMAVRHIGVNKGAVPARVLAVFMGVQDHKNVERNDAAIPPSSTGP